jgi:glycosyltransferase involved in cell wall biosynthesis
MSKPVIWYLHHYAGSPSQGMSYRPYYLSQVFNQSDHNAYVIAASFHHLQRFSIKTTAPVTPLTIDNQPFIFLKTCPYTSSFKRVVNMFSYAYKLWRYRKKIIKITGRPDVIIVSSSHPYHFFSAQRIAKQYNAKLIFEVRDLWPLSLIELLNMSRWHPLILLTAWVERSAYRHADQVVSLLPNASAYMQSRGLKPERFVYISNGVDETTNAQLALPEDYQQYIGALKTKGHFLLGYAGAHGVPNSLDHLIEAMNTLKQAGAKHIHVVLVGNGVEKIHLQQLAKQYALENVSFFDSISKSQIPSFLALMDAVYLGWKNRAIYQYGVSPNKLYDYMLAAKPILHAFSAPCDLVAETKAGLTVEAENPQAIAAGLLKLAAMSKVTLQQMGENGRAAVLSRFTYAVLGKEYMRLFVDDAH